MNNFKNKIILGDCIEEMKKLPSNSFDIVIADPPYNIGKDFGNNFDNYSLEEYLSWSKKWIRECRRLLKDTGTMFVYGFDEILAHLSVMFPLSQQTMFANRIPRDFLKAVPDESDQIRRGVSLENLPNLRCIKRMRKGLCHVMYFLFPLWLEVLLYANVIFFVKLVEN